MYACRLFSRWEYSLQGLGWAFAFAGLCCVFLYVLGPLSSLAAIAAGLYLYLGLDSWQHYPLMLPVFGFFVFGVFSGHAVYLPELFPTHVRATAVAFCNGSGRIITSFGPLVAGLLVVPFGGSFNKAAAVMTCFAVLSIIAML